jgi:hypothetical protein
LQGQGQAGKIVAGGGLEDFVISYTEETKIPDIHKGYNYPSM